MNDKYAVMVNVSGVILDTNMSFEDAVELKEDSPYETTIVNMENI